MNHDAKEEAYLRESWPVPGALELQHPGLAAALLWVFILPMLAGPAYALYLFITWLIALIV